MKVLALETSGWSGAAAILDGDSVVAAAALPEKTRTAVGLASLIKSLLDDAKWKAHDVDLVAVTKGPGSFTGLRVGITTAKTFAYAADAEVFGANTLEVIAHGCFAAGGPNDGRLKIVMDAQRKQLFAAEYLRVADGDSFQIKTESDCRIVDGEACVAAVASDDASIRMAGPGLEMKLADGDTVMQSLQKKDLGGITLPPEHWQANAVSVGQLAVQKYAAGERDDLWTLSPSYFRLSAAEEKAARAANESS